MEELKYRMKMKAGNLRMRVFRIKLMAKGDLTQIPDSQKLFGVIIYKFSEKYGSDKATKFTKAVWNRTIFLALSNILPSGYLPTPQEYLMDQLAAFESKDLNLKKVREQIKERSYIKAEDLKNVFKNPVECKNIYPYIKLNNYQQLRASINSIQYNLPELDTNLYSVPTVVLSEVIKESGELRSKPVKQYEFYLEIDDNNFENELIALIDDLIKENALLIMGKRASQGLNTFQVVGKEEMEPDQNEYGKFLNTGMLLPDGIDYKNSWLKLFTSERRPYEMLGGWNKDFDKYYISFIAEGSVLSISDGLKNAGKCLESVFNKKRDIIFGNAFLYSI